MDDFHLDTPTYLSFDSVRVAESTPLRAVVAADLVFGASKASVTITLDAVPASVQADARSLLRFDVDMWVHR